MTTFVKKSEKICFPSMAVYVIEIIERMETMGNSYESLNAPWTASGQKTRLSLLQRMNAEQVDEQTWQEFFRKYSPFILMMGNSRTYKLRRDEIKELWSKVFLEIHEKGIGAYDREKGSFRSWFKRCIKNKIFDILRKRNAAKEILREDIWAKNEGTISDDDEEHAKIYTAGDNGEPLADSDDEYEKIWQKMLLYSLVLDLKDELAPIHFQVFFMVVLQGHKPQEAASASGIKPDNARQIVSRIKKTLHERFSQLQEETPLASMSADELIAKEAELYKEYHAVEKEYADLLK